MRRLTVTASVAVALASGAAPAALAAAPQPPGCPLFAPRAAVSHELTLPGGATAIARDPYGGLLSRNRLEFDFSLRGEVAGVERVTWSLDGAVKRTDDTAPFEWKGVSGSSKMPAGDHDLTVTAYPADGAAPVSTTFALGATDCQPAIAYGWIGTILTGTTRKGSQLYASSSQESDEGPVMRAATFTGTGVTASIPSAVRGLTAGKLVYSAGDGIPSVGRPRPGAHTLALRVPRRGSTLAAKGSLRVVLHPGAADFLTVTGLPAGVREAMVTLTGRAGQRLLAPKHDTTSTCRYSVGARITGVRTSVRAAWGTVGGTC